MTESHHIVVGRSRDCGLVVNHGTVSGRHARLTWHGRVLLLEDLGSANGTWVRGQRITHTEIRPGDEIRLGAVSFPWGHPSLHGFLRKGAAGDTILGMSIPGRKFICGNCGQSGLIPHGFASGTLECTHCATVLIVGARPDANAARKGGLRARTMFGAIMVLAVVGGIGFWLWQNGGEERARIVGERLQPIGPRATSEPELSVRVHSRDGIVASMDSGSSVVRNAAAQLAADQHGSFSVEQVAAVWSHVRGQWRYVNDPQGSDYFARASETITNGFVGDCDDFAIVVASMINAIGGRTRLVMMNGPEGGHAYPEVCLESEAEDVRARLDAHYRALPDRSLRQRVNGIHFRPATDCRMWLNLDWNAQVPGGPYESETWAIAVYPDGKTETLAVAAAGAGE